jgi:DNA repair protein RadA/Sms
MNIKEQKFINPKTGRTVNYWRAKHLGIIPQELLQESRSTKIVDTKDIEVKTIKISDLNFDNKLFVPMKTGNRHLDKFVSSDGGFMPATNVILIGSPGIGKSTVGMNFISRLKKQGKKVLFISGEMNRIDMFRYCKRFKEFADLDILFLSDYADSNPQHAIEKVLENGYDVVLIDSWAEVCRTVQDTMGWGKSKAESWILDVMEKHNEGDNQSKSYTCFLVIQQVTKSGEFLGSNRLKHMTSAMLDMYRDRQNNRNVMEFSKNRVGTAGEQVSFNISRGSITYARVEN